jgi:tetratricopeptide (TPR) repeat protein
MVQRRPRVVNVGIVQALLSFYSGRMNRVAVLCLLAVTLCMCGCLTDPRSSTLAADYYNVANAYVDLGRYDTAIERYLDALRLDPGLVKADYNLALAYAHQKKTDEAVTILTRLLQNDPKNTQFLSTLGWAYHLGGKDAEALAQYDAVVALSPADQAALYNSGIVLWKLDRQKEALARFTALLALAPDDTDALYAAGALQLSLGDPSSASDTLSRYVAKKKDDIEAWYLVAEAAEKQQKYARALEAYDTIVAADAKQGDALYGEARLLLTVVEDPSRGLDDLAKALAAGFKDETAIKALLGSSALLDRDKVEAALKAANLLPE